MGCDIHGTIESQRYVHRGESGWTTFAVLGMRPRDYRLFAAMTNGEVRGHEGGWNTVALRGFPADADGEAKDEYYGENWWDRKRSTTLEPVPDWHSPSWLTTEEFSTAVKRSGEVDGIGGAPDPFWIALLLAMQELERSGYPTRIVFWFDN